MNDCQIELINSEISEDYWFLFISIFIRDLSKLYELYSWDL
jgi:hypothetical protein